jgi:hypothetical protein
MKQIQILGPCNTGTNLGARLFKNNTINDKDALLVGSEWKVASSPKTLKVDTINESNTCVIDKHSIDKKKLTNVIGSRQDVLFVCMYRPLKNWILSVKKEKYRIAWDYKLTSRVGFRNQIYKNIVDLYNHYYENYIYLINKHTNIIYLEYNKIIIKEHLLDYLNQKIKKYSLTVKSEEHLLETLGRPAKKHGKSVRSYIEALEKYKEQCSYKIDDEDEYYELLNKKIPEFFEK